jgi:predicted pyridoxine 5'-phosphate oxidase superfamily flavin-nucleotide-binding protein
MKNVWHSGERAVHRRLGIERDADRLALGIHETIPPVAAKFLAAQPILIVGVADERRVWASVLEGVPGFARAESPSRIRIDARPSAVDPMRDALHDGAAIGLLAIEPATARRMRLNGRLEIHDDHLVVRTDQVYSNCPRFIQRREIAPPLRPTQPHVARAGVALDAEARLWIESADTFFIASTHPHGGADVSHRGGERGFIRVVDDSIVRFPDYAGNRMFNTLGNIVDDPRVGLLFIDFGAGRILQMTGRARIDWEPDAEARAAGAERVVSIEIDAWLETHDAISTGTMEDAGNPG